MANRHREIEELKICNAKTNRRVSNVNERPILAKRKGKQIICVNKIHSPTTANDLSTRIMKSFRSFTHIVTKAREIAVAIT